MAVAINLPTSSRYKGGPIAVGVTGLTPSTAYQLRIQDPDGSTTVRSFTSSATGAYTMNYVSTKAGTHTFQVLPAPSTPAPLATSQIVMD